MLHRAADLLGEFGHSQGFAAFDEEGENIDWRSHSARSFCAAGAISRAAHDLGFPFIPGHDLAPDYGLADRLLFGETNDYTATWRWNDARGRTKAEVVARLREAAEASAA